MNPDGTSAGNAAEASEADRHFRVIRDLLARDYIGRADWTYALHDLAALAKDALRARQTLVALHNPETGGWTACTSDGEVLTDEAISAHGSRSVLERVRQSEKPVLTTDDAGGPLEFVTDGETGFVVPPRPEALGAALAKAWEREEALAALGRRGLERASRLSWDATIGRLMAAAGAQSVRVETVTAEESSEVARYASLLLSGTYAVEYLRLGLVED